MKKSGKTVFICQISVSNNDTKILKHHLAQKWIKLPFVIYVDVETIFQTGSSYKPHMI